MDEEIDLKTFVVIIEWFEHFQSQICGYFLLAQAKERKESFVYNCCLRILLVMEIL